MRPSRGKSNKQQREEIAYAAARLVADGEAQDFAGAKLKAVESLGLVNSRNMPDNLQVQSALISYLQFYEGQILIERLATMRQAALTAMQFFKLFEPRLVGPVLYGSAVEHSAVTLHLYTDELESVTRFLYDENIEYQLTGTTLKVNSRESLDFPTYIVLNNGFEFELVVFPWSFYAHPPLSGLDARRYKRADADAVQQLIDESLSSIDANLATSSIRDGQ